MKKLIMIISLTLLAACGHKEEQAAKPLEWCAVSVTKFCENEDNTGAEKYNCHASTNTISCYHLNEVDCMKYLRMLKPTVDGEYFICKKITEGN